MEPSKKTSKKPFSVPCAKGNTSGTDDATPQDKASPPQAGKDKSGKGGRTVKKTDKPQSATTKTVNKTDKPQSATTNTVKTTDKPQSATTKTMKQTDKPQSATTKSVKTTDKPQSATTKAVKKPNSKRTFLPKKPTPRSLTPAEYEDIFQSVIENFSKTPEEAEDEEEENVYVMAPTLTTEKESPVTNVETTCVEERGGGDEENSDLEHSDKENISRNENAVENANDDDDRLVDDGDDGEETNKAERSDSKSKPCDNKDNTHTKTSNDDRDEEPVTTVPRHKQLKKKDREGKAPKKEKTKKCRQDVEKETENEGKDGKIKRKKTKDSIKDQKKIKCDKDFGVDAKKNKKETDSAQAKSKPKQSETDETTSKDPDKDEDDDSKKNLTTDTDCCEEKSKKKPTAPKEQETRETKPKEKKKKKKETEKQTEEKKTKPRKKKNKDRETETNEINSKKTENTEPEKDCRHGKESECEINETSPQNVETADVNSTDCKQEEPDSQKNKDEEKAEASSEEREEEDGKCEEKDEAESVVSERSLGSSLMDMAQAVDQWDRLEEIKERNEHTPCVNDSEGKPTVAHKLKRKKLRENQLAPRKLSFEGAAGSKKKRQRVQCSESDDAASIPAELGTWVQCEDRGCQKWRYLADIHDPMELPSQWVCSMNTDERHNSCATPQQDYDESDHIFTKFTLGSLVWAKMDGFPWWPAMVDTDPDADVYCVIPHEDSMVPVEYHVVFLDESVTRSWIRQSRLQALTLDHLGPASVFRKGHRYQKDMQVAMRKAEAALHTPLQDRVKQFGFAACFRNVSTRWTKAEGKKKRRRPSSKPLKRKVAMSSQGQSQGPEPAPAKKRRTTTTGRQLGENDTDSDSRASASLTSLDSDVPSSSCSSDKGGDDDDSDVDDDDEDVRSRFLAKRRSKAEQGGQEGRKMLSVVVCGSHAATDRKVRKSLDTPASKKRSKARSGAVKSHAARRDRSVNSEARRPEREDSSTDSEPDAECSSDDGGHKKPGQPRKKKFKSAKKSDAKSSDKENGHRKRPASKLKNKNAREGRKTGKKTMTTVEAEEREDGTCGGKGKPGKGTKLQGSGGRTKKTMASPEHGSSSKPVLPNSSDRPPKKQKPFKSERTEKDGAPHLQQKEKRADKASAEDRTPKIKSQKFVAPVKPVSKEPDSNLKTSTRTDASLHKESRDEPEVTQPPEKKSKTDDTDFETEDSKLTLRSPTSLSPQPGIRTLSPKQPQHHDLSPHSSPLSPGYKDQFVPSMDNNGSDDDDSDKIELVDDADQLWKKKSAGDKASLDEDEKGSKGEKEEGRRESDSDCLDLEEDLPLPSLQQVLEVPSKGCSDHDSITSDPLEMAEQ